MLISGLQKTTLLDYPGHVAATVFTGGCNFRCPFCHNGELVLRPKDFPAIPEEEILGFLRKRRGILEGVCITGGEPTLQKELKDFIQRIRELEYLIKLDTNGYAPDVLCGLMEEGLLDYVAMDIKACKENYARVTGVKGIDLTRIEESVKLLLGQQGIPYEFRTTVVKGLHSVEEFERIGVWLAGAQQYFLQGFRENENLLDPSGQFAAFSVGEMETMAQKARKYIAKVEVRGVE